jgi:hypothetical protein
MGHRIREAMKSGTILKVSGEAEVDETFIGGLEKNKHEHKKLKQGRGGVGKAIVLGVLNRGDGKGKSTVTAKIIPDRGAEALQGNVQKYVVTGSYVYTDAHKSYKGLSPEYAHAFVDHAVAYAIGRVHTNGLENFWSLLKRSVKGTYVAVMPFHLTKYVDEQAWRFNYRGTNDGSRFLIALSSVSGKRLDYNTLRASCTRHWDEFGV